MRQSRQEKARSRERILDAAAAIMRAEGIERTGVADIMRRAEMTHGGFYRHFDSKEALVASALDTAFADFLHPLQTRIDSGDAAGALTAFEARYLSADHVAAPAQGCPLPALGADLARATAPVRAAAARGIARTAALLAAALPGTPERRHARALRRLATLVGAVTLARAADAETAEAILAACTPPD